jgi:hypothetical protein
MRRSTLGSVVFAVVVGTATILSAAEAKPHRIYFDRVMSESQQQKMGVSRLSPQEREALEEWLTTFVTFMAMSGAKEPPARESPSPVDRRAPSDSSDPPPSKAVAKNPPDDDGPVRVNLGPVYIRPRILMPIELDAGSPSYWQREVLPDRAMPGLAGRTTAASALVDAYAVRRPMYRVRESMGRGAFLLLEDGSLWQIAPTDRHSTSSWGRQDRVTVVESDDPRYPYKLICGRDVVEARFVAR